MLPLKLCRLRQEEAEVERLAFEVPRLYLEVCSIWLEACNNRRRRNGSTW